MATQVPVTLVNGGGALTPLQIKRAACKAFREAVDEYCKSPPGSRGSFNDKFFDKLKDVTPNGADIAKSISREVPMLAGKAGGVASGVAGTAGDLAAADPGNAAANFVNDQYVKELANLPGGASGVAGPVGSCFAIGAMFAAAGGKWLFFNALRAAGFRLGFPDGAIGSQAIEIKGPGDSFRKNQKETFDAASKPNPTIVVDCKSCGADCKNGPVKGLKGKWKSNVGCP
jgi:hypothetical protein